MIYVSELFKFVVTPNGIDQFALQIFNFYQSNTTNRIGEVLFSGNSLPVQLVDIKLHIPHASTLSETACSGVSVLLDWSPLNDDIAQLVCGKIGSFREGVEGYLDFTIHSPDVHTNLVTIPLKIVTVGGVRV